KAAMAADALKTDIYNPSLRAFDEKRLSYIKGKTALGDFADFLFKEADKTSHPLKYYPNLASLSQIKEKESKIDFTKANQEQQKLLSRFSQDQLKEIFGEEGTAGGPSALDGKDHKELHAFYAALAEKADGFRDFPELKKYFEYLGLARSFSARQTLEE